MAVSKQQLNILWKFFLFGFLLIENYGFTEAAIRNIKLIIKPPAVRRGQSATLYCLYDLDKNVSENQKTTLYSIKFYRGPLEFYRFTPAENPSTKVIPLQIFHVDTIMSNASQVVLRNIGFHLAGNFSCEVTAESPNFSTATGIAVMQVVELPEKRPYVWTDQDRYIPNDILRANCSSPPSKPRTILKFTLNNMVLTNVETEYTRTLDGLEAASISLKLPLLHSHFAPVPSYGSSSSSSSTSFSGIYNLITSSTGGYNNNGNINSGSLLLKCIAQIGELYQESSDPIELGVQQKDPIPARVTSSLSTRPQCFQQFNSILILILINSIFLKIIPLFNQVFVR